MGVISKSMNDDDDHIIIVVKWLETISLVLVNWRRDAAIAVHP